MADYFVDLISKIIKELTELGSYFEGKNKAAELLGHPENKAAFVYNIEENCYEIKSNMDPDELIDKILEGSSSNKMGENTTNMQLATREEEEQLPKLREGSIHKRKDGRWQGKYYDNGVRRCIYAKTKKDIITKVNKAIVARNKADKAKIITNKITLGKWINKWLEMKSGDLKEATIRNYEIHLVKKVAAHPISKKQIKFINSMDIQRFMKSIDAPSSKARTFRQLKSCFSDLYKNKIIKDNPFDNIKNIVEPHNKKFVPTKLELDQFLDYLKNAYYEIYLFAKFISLTGVRKGEALALTWNDIKDEYIVIDKAWENTAKKVQTPKTKASIRNIPLFPEVKLILNEITTITGEVFSFIFKGSVGHRFHEHVLKANLNGLTFHSLRHYFATQCLEAGIEKKVVQKWLGHSKYEVTINTYSHINTQFETQEVEKLAKFRADKKKI